MIQRRRKYQDAKHLADQPQGLLCILVLLVQMKPELVFCKMLSECSKDHLTPWMRVVGKLKIFTGQRNLLLLNNTYAVNTINKHIKECFHDGQALTGYLYTHYLRNFPSCSGQFSEPLLSKGLSPLSFRFFEFLPMLLLFPPEFNLTRMHFDEASGPSTVSVTRNLKLSLKKLCIA